MIENIKAAQSRKNVIFWHTCQLGPWKEIVQEQFDTLESSGILDVCENVYITFLGKKREDISWLIEKHPKFILFAYDPDLGNYERLCLMSLLEWSQENEANVLYIHNKGASRNNTENIRTWRKAMEYFLIENYKTCLEDLKEYDALGCMIKNEGRRGHNISNEAHKMHFSGNFWWSKTEYLKNLPSLNHIDLRQNSAYWLCERWVLHSHPNVKIKELYRGHGRDPYRVPLRGYK